MRIIAGEFRGRTIKTGTGPGYRPATGKIRESLFSMLEAMGLKWSETNVLDMFAGSGSLGIEALSRGAKSALFVEKSPGACAIIRQNIAMLSISGQRARVVNANALTFLNRHIHKTFGLVFVDPPYENDLAGPALEGLLKANLTSKDGLISAEIEAHLDFEAQQYPEMEIMKDRLFGQTRILIWKKK